MSDLEQLLHDRWDFLYNSCYNPDRAAYGRYGGEGVAMVKRWHDPTHFINDVQQLSGFDLKKVETRTTHMVRINSLLYSPKTCIFVEGYSGPAINTVQAISPDGDIWIVVNQSNFGRLHDVPQSTIANALRGDVEHARGWELQHVEFSIKEINEYRARGRVA